MNNGGGVGVTVDKRLLNLTINKKFAPKFKHFWSQILLVNLYLELNLKSKNRVNYKFGLLEKWLP
ncbi:hypothetical protein [Campylobacter concisus]|uniref:Uncharacterized protein n=1 Tax=Campylobacter concisus TaxID=199 RepID=A0A7S9RG12_9BACT|nr:hypothetical protein [Campylobacter concisus]QPH91064.1 hypothetical protein CVT01_00440 [Campylobacter concisus]